MNLLDPPAFWTQSTSDDFYGEFVRSAYIKRPGKGKEKVVWNVDIKESGDYDIYYYQGLTQRIRQGIQSGRGAPRSGGSFSTFRGTKYFSVSVRDGIEEVEIDLAETGQGWNLIGSFQLDAGPNTIELTDKNDAGYVLADAVKWVKKRQ
jgi:hypothetical protein